MTTDYERGFAAGVEAAAKWHDTQARRWYESEPDATAAGWHRSAAAEIRALRPSTATSPAGRTGDGFAPSPAEDATPIPPCDCDKPEGSGEHRPGCAKIRPSRACWDCGRVVTWGGDAWRCECGRVWDVDGVIKVGDPTAYRAPPVADVPRTPASDAAPCTCVRGPTSVVPSPSCAQHGYRRPAPAATGGPCPECGAALSADDLEMARRKYAFRPGQVNNLGGWAPPITMECGSCSTGRSPSTPTNKEK